MLKTRAYLCQTVTEATPMSRLVSTFAGQARQALEGLFRRTEVPKIPLGTITRSEAPVLAVGRRGLVSGIDRGGRSVIRNFLSKNRPADLAAAMRKRYSVRGEFQGLGQKLATFGFVGVGVAAGSQWSGSDVDGDFHFEPFFDTVREMYGASKVKVDSSLAMLTDFERNLDDFSQYGRASFTESELSFDLLDDSRISPEASSHDVTSEISMLSDAVIELTNHDSDDAEAAEMIVQFSPSIVIEESQAQLGAELLAVMTTADAQRQELQELQVILSQLGLLLSQLSPNTTPADDFFDDFVVIEGESVEDGDMMDDNKRLWRALSLVSRQKQQLNILHKTVCAQNDRLMSLSSGEEMIGLTVIPRSAHCKRDACCGPGSAG